MVLLRLMKMEEKLRYRQNEIDKTNKTKLYKNIIQGD